MKVQRVRAGCYRVTVGRKTYIVEDVTIDCEHLKPGQRQWNISEERDGFRQPACDAAGSLAQAKAMIEGW